MRAFLKKHLRYPPEASANKIEGTVVLRIAINYKGKVIDSKVKSSLGYGCDEEAQRVVKLLEFEVDQKMRKGKILFHKDININFKRPKNLPARTEVSYQLSSKKKSTQKKPTAKKQPYTYTIVI